MKNWEACLNEYVKNFIEQATICWEEAAKSGDCNFSDYELDCNYCSFQKDDACMNVGLKTFKDFLNKEYKGENLSKRLIKITKGEGEDD